jgi:CAAX prenyl protease-like protein
VIAIILICLRKHYTELQWKWSAHGVWVGLVALAIWLVPYWKFIPGLPAPDAKESGFNPLQFHDNPLAMWALIGFRLAGAALVIPFVEELLFRSCIARLTVDLNKDLRAIPVGSFTWASLAITTVAFTVGHRPWEWLPSVLVGALYYWLVVWRKNILDCIVAHGVTNLALGIYVLTTEQWYWW